MGAANKEPIKALKKELRSIAVAMDKVADRYRSIGGIIIGGTLEMSASQFKEAIEDSLNRFRPTYRKQVRAFLTGIHKLAREGVVTPEIWSDERIAELDVAQLFKLIRALKKSPFEEAILIASGNKQAPNKGAENGGRDKPTKVKGGKASLNLKEFESLSKEDLERYKKAINEALSLLTAKIDGGDSVAIVNLYNFLKAEGYIE